MPVGGQDAWREECHGEEERDEGPEHRGPAEGTGEDASDRAARQRAEGARGSPHRHGAGAFGSGGEDGTHQGEGGGEERGGAEALGRACGDEQAGVPGEGADDGGGAHEYGAGHEHAAGAEAVHGPAAEEQETAVAEGEGVDHPLERGRGEAERGADLGQRDVDDVEVDRDDEVGRGQEGERQRDPSTAARRRGGGRVPGRGVGRGAGVRGGAVLRVRRGPGRLRSSRGSREAVGRGGFGEPRGLGGVAGACGGHGFALSRGLGFFSSALECSARE